MLALSEDLLSAVVPFTKLTPQMLSWVPTALKSNIAVILVHDDHSFEGDIDGSDRLIDIELLKALGAVVIHGNFGNPGAARNRGLKEVKSEWVTFWDSDDSPLVAKVMRAFVDGEISDIDYIVGDFITKSQSNELPEYKIFNDRNIYSIATHPGIWRFIFRTRTLEMTRFPELSMGEDQIFLANYGLASHRGKFLGFETYEYFLSNPDSLTNSPASQSRTVKALTRLVDDLNNLNPKDVEFALMLAFKLAHSSWRYGSWIARRKVVAKILSLVLHQQPHTLISASLKLFSTLKDGKTNAKQ